MTTLDEHKPATAVHATPGPPWPRPGRRARESVSSPPRRRASSRRSPLHGNVRATDSVPVNDPEWVYLPGTPWSMRLTHSSGGCPALEVYAAGSLIDVTVVSPRASHLLRGACMMAVARHPRVIAWGCLHAARGELPSVEFIRGRIHRRAQPAEAERVADWFWFADASGWFRQVVTTSQEGCETFRTRTADAC
jgi:hypothetical protein